MSLSFWTISASLGYLFFKIVFFCLWGFFLSPTLSSSCRSLRIFSWLLKWWIIHYFIIVYRLQNTKHCEFHFKLYLYLSSEPLLKLFSLITAFTSQLQLKLMIFNWKSYRNMFLNLYIYIVLVLILRKCFHQTKSRRSPQTSENRMKKRHQRWDDAKL